MRAEIAGRRDPSKPPGYEVADFEEYTRLYHEAWTEPSIRWLFSTVPVSMIFDDHDVRDDWNTSHAWRVEMQATDWWEERITGALMSYWIYQHLGNLSPDGLAADETLRAVRERTMARPSSVPSPSTPTARRTARRARCGPTAATSAGSGSWSSTPAADACSPKGRRSMISDDEFALGRAARSRMATTTIS